MLQKNSAKNKKEIILSKVSPFDSSQALQPSEGSKRKGFRVQLEPENIMNPEIVFKNICY